MSDARVEIKVRDDGPYKVTGAVRIIDVDGHEIPLPDDGHVALCRCGGSRTMPFCDRTHRERGFSSRVRANSFSDGAESDGADGTAEGSADGVEGGDADGAEGGAR